MSRTVRLTVAPASDSWWDVPVSEVSELDSTRDARAVYDSWKPRQRPYLTPSGPRTPISEEEHR